MDPSPRHFPALFVSHGAPTIAIENDGWTAALEALGKELPRPRAVVIASAHWQTQGGVAVTGSARPETIHDFGGFPDALYALRYPAPGDPALARDIAQRLRATGLSAEVDEQRGLDHGAWVPLMRLLPKADVPALQLSLPMGGDPDVLLQIGKALAPLRDEGVLLVGSGGATHNLRRLRFGEREAAPMGYASEFDRWLWERVQAGDVAALRGWRDAPSARAAHPTAEHLDPLFVVLGAAQPGETAYELHAEMLYGGLSMRSFVVR